LWKKFLRKSQNHTAWWSLYFSSEFQKDKERKKRKKFLPFFVYNERFFLWKIIMTVFFHHLLFLSSFMLYIIFSFFVRCSKDKNNAKWKKKKVHPGNAFLLPHSIHFSRCSYKKSPCVKSKKLFCHVWRSWMRKGKEKRFFMWNINAF